ncbi:response regulator transcription factor [Ruminococcus sp. 5_1_39BFAA]|uniref:response regulator transcription factor n=1 Tax=Ruminococcus sp. 5_1_39BFAA TaxID=457412 RepID=UPI0035636693
MGKKILVADDDFLIRDLLRDILEQEGYEVAAAEDGIRALEYYRGHQDLDLIILDILMPGKNGLSVLREIHRNSRIPVIMLTALGSSENELEGFQEGACDYISKPFHAQVLLARVRAALEYKAVDEPENRNRYTMGKLTVDLDGCTVRAAGVDVELTNKEYQLLVYLMENRNIVLSRNQILERIWGFDYEGDIRTIDTHIKMLRTDLGECGNYIRTVRGMGYVFQWEEGV